MDLFSLRESNSKEAKEMLFPKSLLSNQIVHWKKLSSNYWSLYLDFYSFNKQTLCFPTADSRTLHHSPPYLYGTLPYNRSQSPCVPLTPQRTAGYVTIPRRPRASWSAGPTSLEPPLSLTLDPVYDSCGKWRIRNA